MAFFDTVYSIIREIPQGKVATYGDIAVLCGNPRMARQVGWALHNNPEPGLNPCHRVVFVDGSICPSFAFGGIEAQKALLESEGVEVSEDYKIDLNKYRWSK